MKEQVKGVPPSGSGSQASPGAAKASPPSVSIPNAECSVGVGDGSGQLFVHGSYDAIKRVQGLIFELEQLRVEVDRFRRPNRRALSTRDPINPLPTFQPQHLLGLALLFREWCQSDMWGRPQEAELAARQVETAYHIITTQSAAAMSAGSGCGLCQGTGWRNVNGYGSTDWQESCACVRDSDGSPKGGDACGSVACDDSAGRQASPKPHQETPDAHG